MHIRLSAFFSLLWCLLIWVDPSHAQSVAELQSKLGRAKDKGEKMTINHQLAQKLLNNGRPADAVPYAVEAARLATEIGDRRKEAEATLLAGEGEYKARNYSKAVSRYTQAWNYARNSGLRDIALNATERLQDIALRDNNFKEALKWSRETVAYLKETGGGGRSGGDAARRLEDRLSKAESENRLLREQLAQATGQTEVLRQTEAQLRETQEKKQQELQQQKVSLSKTTQKADSLGTVVRKIDYELSELTKEQLASSIKLERQEKELQEEKRKVAETALAQERVESTRNVLALVSVLVLVLAGSFYMRYRAKRRAADDLSAKNALIDQERKRSDELLLNILPPAIATELKSRNKVAAQRYERASVMFIDFKGFTLLSEKLSPERLVEELDHCFSNFDHIIGKYRIEKIKTIGDAYMCASGLSDKNDSAADLIRAALEIQDFLLGLKAERMSQGLPCFEARIGIHLGPVIAGVVGAKKFAYDIWGDTVNVASRMEETCEIGRVNVSEDAYISAKYEFEWEYRGKLAAKNKGEMEMYYVKGMK